MVLPPLTRARHIIVRQPSAPSECTATTDRSPWYGTNGPGLSPHAVDGLDESARLDAVGSETKCYRCCCVAADHVLYEQGFSP